MKTRQHKLITGFMSTGFEYKGVTYRPLTAQDILTLNRVNSPIYTGEMENLLEWLLDYLFVTSQPKEVITAAIEDWQQAIFDFADRYTYEDILELSEMIADIQETIAAALVEVEDEGEKKSVMNPCG